MSKEDDPKEWLSDARSFINMLDASKKQKDVKKGHLAFLCQQTAEIAIKGVLVHLNLSFVKTHSIRNLLEIMVLNGYKIPDDIMKAITLSEYAVTPRYPGDYDEITKEELKDIIKIAKKVLKWAEKIIQDKNTLSK